MTSIDHFYVFAKRGAPEQQRLLARGLQVGMRRDHQGQGTRNICFSFADCYLELLWIDDQEEAHNDASKPLRLLERSNWRESHASPFGICLRSDIDTATPPFAHWDYRPAYLPDGMAIAIARSSDAIEEPMLFLIDRAFEPFGETHLLSRFTLHSLLLTTPTSPTTNPVPSRGVPRFEAVHGDEHLMTVTLQNENSEVGSQQLDLRPELPLVLRW